MDTKKTICTTLILTAAFLTFGSIATAVDTINTDEKNIEQLKPEDIKPATTQELKVIDDEQTIIDTNNTTTGNQENTQADATEKKELPVLEDIELPNIQSKAVDSKPVKIEVSSQRIPAGTNLPVRLDSPINSAISHIGDQFNATLTADVIVGDNLILPAGSVIRGTVGSVKKAGLCVSEGKVMLIFDHIVTPAGKQIPVYAYLKDAENVNYEGYITGGTSYVKAFKKDAARSKEIIVNSTNFGVDKGLAYLKGIPVVITAPVCAIGGTLGGGGYIVGKSVYNIFYRGDDVSLNKGTVLNITLSKALDIPVN